MTAPAPATDGNLPATLCTLQDAVAALIDPQAHTVRGALQLTDSRHTQLVTAIAGFTRERSGGASSLPIWPEAFDLLHEIERTVNAWRPPPTNYEWWFGTPHPGDTRPRTVRQLAALPLAKWRPQDCDLLEEHSTNITKWVKRIDTLLADEHHSKHLTAPCPACDTRTVYRNNGGERVRQAALQIDAQGCHCLECHARWSPEYFVHLARVIGCPTPAGVLE